MNRDELLGDIEAVEPGPGQDVLIQIDGRVFDFRIHYDDWGTYLIPIKDNGQPLMPKDLEEE